LAATFQSAQERTLGLGCLPCRRVVYQGDQLAGCFIVAPHFNTQRTLADSGEHHIYRKKLANSIGAVQPDQSRGREHDGIILAFRQFTKAGVHVAPEIEYPQVRPGSQYLRPSAQAAGAYSRGRGQLQQATSATAHNQHVAGIGSLQDRAQDQAARLFGGHILKAVHRQVYLASQQGSFDLLNEQSFSPNLRKCPIPHPVTQG
jgi:hypothetical protein